MQSHGEERYRFPLGLPAFDEDREFRVTAEPEWRPFRALESLRPGGPRFICIEIAALVPGFSLELSEEEAAVSGCAPGRHIAEEAELELLAIVAELEDGTLTANLAAPVVLNRKGGLGVQSVQQGSAYSAAMVIRRAAGGSSCS